MKNIVLPQFGPVQTSPAKFHTYLLQDGGSTHETRRKLANKAQKKASSENILATYHEGSLVTFQEPLPFDEVAGVRIRPKKREWGKTDQVKLWRAFIREAYHRGYREIGTDIGGAYLFDAQRIAGENSRGIELELFKHDAVRFSLYLGAGGREFLLLIYPFMRATVRPEVDKLILAGLDVKKQEVVSPHEGIPNGTISRVWKAGEGRYDLEFATAREKWNKQKIPVPEGTPLIRLRSSRKGGTDQWLLANAYWIQAKFSFDQRTKNLLFNWDLQKVGNQLRMSEDEYMERASTHARQLETIFKKWGVIP